MDYHIWGFRICLFIGLLAIEFVYYGFGSALQNLNFSLLKQRAEEGQDKKSERILKLAESPAKYINTVQLIITCIQLAMGGYFLGNLSGLLHSPVGKFFPDHEMAETIIATVLSSIILLLIILIFGVMLPKKLGAKYSMSWVYAFIRPIEFINIVFTPLTSFISLVSSGLARIFGIKPSDDEYDVTEEEILSMVNEGHEQGVLEQSEAEMINNIFDFSDKEAHDIMTNRVNIIGIDGNSTLNEAVAFMLSGANSRYPVFVDNIDHVIGILFLKDACRHAREHEEDEEKPLKNLRGLLRETIYVPETINIDDLFAEMQTKKSHMVLVIDEYGQTSGILTMEDILEEIVGNIFDEYDDEDAYIQRIGKATYEIDGLVPLTDLSEKLGIDTHDDEFETLNGLMISRLEHIPEENEIFSMDYGGYTFQIREVQNKTIKKVLVTKIEEPVKEGEE
ncbi:MAG: hemolysin family protein [Lachnospiraceae bacterium]|nr:hemolysin family protein [Lachnospiraceae bacterium]